MSKALIQYQEAEYQAGELELNTSGWLRKKPLSNLKFMSHFDEDEKAFQKEVVSDEESIYIFDDIHEPEGAYPGNNNPDFKACLKTLGIIGAVGKLQPCAFTHALALTFHFRTSSVNTGGIPNVIIDASDIFNADTTNKVFKAELINNGLKITVYDYPGQDAHSVQWNGLEAGVWYRIAGVVTYDSLTDVKTLHLYIDGEEKATSGTWTSNVSGLNNPKPVLLLFDYTMSMQLELDDVAVWFDQSKTDSGITPQIGFKNDDAIAVWKYNSGEWKTIWDMSSLSFVAEPDSEIKFRLASADSEGDLSFEGSKLTYQELILLDDPTGKYISLEITYPGGEGQYTLAQGTIDYQLVSRDYYSSVSSVLYRTGVNYKDLGCDNTNDLQLLIEDWLIEAKSFIDYYTHQSWTGDTVPKAVASIAARIVSGMISIAQERRKSPVVRLGDYSLRLVEDKIITDDIKSVLDLYSKSGTGTAGGYAISAGVKKLELKDA